MEEDNNIVSYLIDSPAACEDPALLKSVEAATLPGNSGLDAISQARLQEILPDKKPFKVGFL